MEPICLPSTGLGKDHAREKPKAESPLEAPARRETACLRASASGLDAWVRVRGFLGVP